MVCIRLAIKRSSVWLSDFDNDSGQVVCAPVSVSTSSIIWYWPKSSELQLLGKVTADLAESYDSLPPGLWLVSLYLTNTITDWLPRDQDHLQPMLMWSMELSLPFWSVQNWITEGARVLWRSAWTSHLAGARQKMTRPDKEKYCVLRLLFCW